MSDRKALNIGINNFQNYPGFALKGCINDVKNFNKVLVENLGFSEGDIVELVDEQATKANIINNLKSIVDDARQGRYSYVVLKLSTHGTQRLDAGGDEVDQNDEVFVPYDISQTGNKWDEDRIIVDDDLAKILSQLPPNVLFEGFADTCHSGTGFRRLGTEIAMLMALGTPSAATGTARSTGGSSEDETQPSLPSTPRYLPLLSTDRSLRSLPMEDEGAQWHGMREAIADEGMKNLVWWSGCRDDQTSADANISGAGWNGAMTYYLCEGIRKSGNSKSRAAIMQGLREALAGRYSQVPQLFSASENHTHPITSWSRSAAGGKMPDEQISLSTLIDFLQELSRGYAAYKRSMGVSTAEPREPVKIAAAY
jgi:hypothetical protein